METCSAQHAHTFPSGPRAGAETIVIRMQSAGRQLWAAPAHAPHLLLCLRCLRRLHLSCGRFCDCGGALRRLRGLRSLATAVALDSLSADVEAQSD